MPSRSEHWAFTLNNYTDEDLITLTDASSTGIPITARNKVIYLVFGFEEAPTTGTKHIQGYLQLEKAGEMRDLQAWAGPNYHWSACRGSDEDNFRYCTKEGDFLQWGNRKSIAAKAGQGKRTDLDEVKKLIDDGKSFDDIAEQCFEACAKYFKFIQDRVTHRGQLQHLSQLKDQLSASTLRPWQEEVWQILSGVPDPRKIHWRWDPDGNMGKSWMATYVSVLRNGLILEPGKKTDLAYIFSKKTTGIVIFDLNRTTAPDPESKHSPMDVVYSLMESLKNGYLVSTKYDSSTIHFPCPHIVVFANWEPDTSKMSQDRWDIKQIV